MGLNNQTPSISINASLTSLGRTRLLTDGIASFTHFMVGDSDANYQTSGVFTSGFIPSLHGNKSLDGFSNTNVIDGFSFSKIYTDRTNVFQKPVEKNDNLISKTFDLIDQKVADTTDLLFAIIDRTDYLSEFSNYFKTLNLPITDQEKSFFNITAAEGGWSDTAFSSLSQDRVLLISFNKNLYGGSIDGRNIEGQIPVYTGTTTGGTPTGLTTYTFYSSFINTTQFSRSQLDNRVSDGFINTSNLLGKNVAFLVSDDIQRPNNDSSQSWSTGFNNLYKPFSVSKKSLINFQSNVKTGINKDKIIGIAYLDRGLIAITDQSIVYGIATDLYDISGNVTDTLVANSTTPKNFFYYTGTTGTTSYVKINSINTNIISNLTCILGRGEFYRSSNSTYVEGDRVRISQIAISDINGTVLAIGSFDRHLNKDKNDFIIVNVNIVG